MSLICRLFGLCRGLQGFRLKLANLIILEQVICMFGASCRRLVFESSGFGVFSVEFCEPSVLAMWEPCSDLRCTVHMFRRDGGLGVHVKSAVSMGPRRASV